MKFTKKCIKNTKPNQSSIISSIFKRCSSADRLYTSSSVSAVTSLILMIALSFLSSAFLNIPGLAGANTYADSISMTVSTDNLTINMAPMSSSGEFAKSANMNIAVSTTSSSGYNLSIASSTGNTNLTSGSDSISSINSAISESTFSSSSTYNNQWGYKPSNLYNSSTEQIITNTDFRPLPGTAGEIIAKTKCANGSSPCTNPVDNYTLSIGTRTTNITPKGDYVSDTFVITAVTNKNVITCDSSKLCVQYDGNGLSYPETSSQLLRTVNNVNYNSTTTQVPITKYSHTSNIDDSGTASGTYPTNQATTDVVTIPGATELNITIYYATGRYGQMGMDATAYVFEGEYTGSISYDTTGYLKKYQSGTGKTKETADTETFTVSGNTVTFGFYSSTGVMNPAYGYYAIITGTGTVYERSVSSGEYATPTGTNPFFYGWSTTQTTPGSGFPSDVEYTNESEILAKMPGSEGETKTLYAVWQQSQAITFTMDSNVTKIDVLDASGTTVGTITSSGQSLALAQGDTYTIKPTFSYGYTTNTITKTSGAGTISGKQFTVGAGTATISITSKEGIFMQDYTLATCQAEASSGNVTLLDSRDNSEYTARYINGACWMTQNLRFTGTSLSTTTSNVSANRTISYGDLASGNSYTEARIHNSDDTTKGVWYNFCAAGAMETGACTNTSKYTRSYDICPKNWHLPTRTQFVDITSYQDAFSPVAGGDYYGGSLVSTGRGYWWSATASDSSNQYHLYYADSSLHTNGLSKYYGHYVRCVRSS